MGILFFLIKFIGILILALLCLFIFVLCLILFVPIEYHFYAEKKADVFGSAQIKWLLGIFGFKAAYFGENIELSLKIFGNEIFEEGGKKKKSEKKQKKQKKSKLHNATQKNKMSEKVDDNSDGVSFGSTDNHVKREANIFDEKIENTDEIFERKEKVYRPEKVKIRRIKMSEVDFQKKNESKEEAENDFTEKNEKNFCSDKQKQTKDNEHIEKDNVDLKYIMNLPFDEKKIIIKAVTKLLERLIKNIWPKNVNIDAVIGVGSPDKTGYVLAVSSVFNALSKSGLNICGEFSKKFFEGNVDVSGKVSIGRIMFSVIAFAFTKPIRKIIFICLKG